MPTDIEKKIQSMIKGDINYTSKVLGFNLLMTRLVSRYKKNPVSSELNSCMLEVKFFVTKYQSFMTKEYDDIRKA